MRNLILIASICSLVSGCASQLKKDCESTNWFKYGEEVAMRGEWLGSDQKLLSCRKEEAEIGESQADLGFKSGRQKYCTDANAFLVGKAGDSLSQNFCEGSIVKTMASKHQLGLREYCAKSNGFNAGASGKKYGNLCPKDLESGFMPEYKKGRSKYLDAQIKNAEDRRRELDYKMRYAMMDVTSQENRIASMRHERTMLESQRSFVVAGNNQALINDYSSRISDLDSNITHAEWKLRDANGEVSKIKAEMDKISGDIASYRTEMAGL